jgi:hypothetical protein
MLPETPYDEIFARAGQQHGVDPALLKAIASVESGFNPNAVGPKTRSGRAQGMMQFVPAMQKAYDIKNPYDPDQSVNAAARMMSDLLKRYDGDVGKALEAYNGGPSMVGKSKQTAQYRTKVLSKFFPDTSTEQLSVNTQQLALTNQASKAPPAMNRGPRTMPTGQPTVTGGRTTAERFPTLSNLRIEDFPMSYQTALALEYLSDTDDDDDPEEKVERLLQEQQALGSRTTAPAGAQMLGKSLGPRSSIRNPFEVLLKMQGQDVNSMEQ